MKGLPTHVSLIWWLDQTPAHHASFTKMRHGVHEANNIVVRIQGHLGSGCGFNWQSSHVWCCASQLTQLQSISVFLFGSKILQNFDLKNMTSNYTRVFFMEKMTQICQISKEKTPNCQIFIISCSSR